MHVWEDVGSWGGGHRYTSANISTHGGGCVHSQAHEYSTTGTQEGMQVGGHEHMSANMGNTGGHSGGWAQEHRWAHLGTHGQEGSGTRVHTRACGWANTGTHLGTWMGQGHAGEQTWAHMLIVVQTHIHTCRCANTGVHAVASAHTHALVQSCAQSTHAHLHSFADICEHSCKHVDTCAATPAHLWPCTHKCQSLVHIFPPHTHVMCVPAGQEDGLMC